MSIGNRFFVLRFQLTHKKRIKEEKKKFLPQFGQLKNQYAHGINMIDFVYNKRKLFMKKKGFLFVNRFSFFSVCLHCLLKVSRHCRIHAVEYFIYSLNLFSRICELLKKSFSHMHLSSIKELWFWSCVLVLWCCTVWIGIRGGQRMLFVDFWVEIKGKFSKGYLEFLNI